MPQNEQGRIASWCIAADGGFEVVDKKGRTHGVRPFDLVWEVYASASGSPASPSPRSSICLASSSRFLVRASARF
jgi:hypothetical protein